MVEKFSSGKWISEVNIKKKSFKIRILFFLNTHQQQLADINPQCAYI